MSLQEFEIPRGSPNQLKIKPYFPALAPEQFPVPHQTRHEKQKLIAKHKEEERKRDAHEKILLGGAVLSILGRPYIEGDEKQLKAFLEKQERNGKYFTSAMNRNLPPPAPEVTPDQNDTENNDGSDDTENILNQSD